MGHFWAQIVESNYLYGHSPLQARSPRLLGAICASLPYQTNPRYIIPHKHPHISTRKVKSRTIEFEATSFECSRPSNEWVIPASPCKLLRSVLSRLLLCNSPCLLRQSPLNGSDLPERQPTHSLRLVQWRCKRSCQSLPNGSDVKDTETCLYTIHEGNIPKIVQDTKLTPSLIGSDDNISAYSTNHCN